MGDDKAASIEQKLDRQLDIQEQRTKKSTAAPRTRVRSRSRAPRREESRASSSAHADTGVVGTVGDVITHTDDRRSGMIRVRDSLVVALSDMAN